MDRKLEKQNLILFMVDSDEPQSSENYKFITPIGTKFLNRFVVEENDQFEVYGLYRINSCLISPLSVKSAKDEVSWVRDGVSLIEKAVQKYAEESKQDKADKNTVHFIWACPSFKREYLDLVNSMNNEMLRFGLKKGMISFIEEERYHCITNEECQQLYRQGGQIHGKDLWLSFGDDLENFLTQIKNDMHERFTPGIIEFFDLINTFHVSLLSPDQKRNLAMNDRDYNCTFLNLKPDVPKEEMAKSDSKSKYAFSSCSRKTHTISPQCLRVKQELYDPSYPTVPAPPSDQRLELKRIYIPEENEYLLRASPYDNNRTYVIMSHNEMECFSCSSD